MRVGRDKIRVWVVGRRTFAVDGLILSLEKDIFTIDQSFAILEDVVASTDTPDICIYFSEEVEDDAIASLRERSNGAFIVVMAASFHDPGAMIRSGASAALSLSYSSEEIVFLLKQIVFASDGFFIFPIFRAKLANEEHFAPPARTTQEIVEPRLMAHLSPREHDVLVGLYRGETNKVLARRLGISEATVKAHVRTLFRKLGAHNRTQAVRHLIESGSRDRTPTPFS